MLFRSVVADLKKDHADKVAAAIGKNARAIECNVTNDDQVKAAITLAKETFGKLNGAINCAGVGAAARVVSKGGPFDLKMFKFVLDVNLVGTFNVIRLCAQEMSEMEPDAAGERGVFVNTASVAAFEGQIGQAAYSASKGGVVSMTQIGRASCRERV